MRKLSKLTPSPPQSPPHREPGFVACRVTLSHGLEHPASFAAGFTELLGPLGFDGARMLVDRRHTVFRSDRFAAHVANTSVESISVYVDERESFLVHLYLRDRDLVADPESERYIDRHHALVVRRDGRDALLRLLALCHEHFGLVSANVAAFGTQAYAQKEAIRHGSGEPLDDATEARVNWDAMKYRRARSKLIRLSPITVIGTTLWATLPPMPRFDPAPVVEDLPGAPGCKVITAWPTLCPPRDPEFLRGTRALRAWLWPYTIQNPADDPANDPA